MKPDEDVSVNPRLKEYETAHVEAEQWMRWYDESLYLFRELQKVFQIVDMKTGELRWKADVIADVETILELLEDEIGAEKIQKGARYIRKYQEALLPYFDEVEAGDLAELVGDEVISRFNLTGRQIIVYLEYVDQKQPVEFSYRLKAKFPVKAKTPKSTVYEYYNPDVKDEALPEEITVTAKPATAS